MEARVSRCQAGRIGLRVDLKIHAWAKQKRNEESAILQKFSYSNLYFIH